jgi:acetoin utilization deacetylase AcuC-like enzyme
LDASLADHRRLSLKKKWKGIAGMITIINPVQALHDPDALGPAPNGRDYLDVIARAETLLATINRLGHSVVSAPDHGMAPIEAVHDAGYLAFLRTAFARFSENPNAGPILRSWAFAVRQMNRKPAELIGQAGYYLSGASSPIVAGTWEASVRSADVAVEAAARVLAGAPEAYALCRPSGHHAYADLAGGFCYLNNAAIAARYLEQAGRKPAILDIDVHHGNGTQGIFYRDGGVFFCSVHEDPAVNYPWYAGYADETGEGAGAGCTLNLPLAPGSGNAPWLAAIDQGLAAIDRFGADMLVISLGFDAQAGDPTATLRIDADGFRAAGRAIGRAGRPTVLVQEGGYLVAHLGMHLAAFLDGFLGARAAR